MIYVTGDIHGDLNRFATPPISKLKQGDILIVAGDFGFVWYNESDVDNYYNQEQQLNDLATLPFMILYVDGNHENHPLIADYPTVEMFGGKVNKIRDNIFHLIRGEVYTIGGKTIFAFGGAYSIDRYLRQEGISFWHEELPDDDDYNNAIANLKKVDHKVDYIITHTAPAEIIKMMGYYGDIHEAELTGFLDWVMYEVQFSGWYFGHWHTDGEKFDLTYYGKDKCFRPLFYDVCRMDGTD